MPEDAKGAIGHAVRANVRSRARLVSIFSFRRTIIQRSSETIGAIAAALAKAQAELANPEKSLVATTRAANLREMDRTFCYAALSTGLDIVRKALDGHESASQMAWPYLNNRLPPSALKVNAQFIKSLEVSQRQTMRMANLRLEIARRSYRSSCANSVDRSSKIVASFSSSSKTHGQVTVRIAPSCDSGRTTWRSDNENIKSRIIGLVDGMWSIIFVGQQIGE
jgi:hypothetical protein